MDGSQQTVSPTPRGKSRSVPVTPVRTAPGAGQVWGCQCQNGNPLITAPHPVEMPASCIAPAFLRVGRGPRLGVRIMTAEQPVLCSGVKKVRL